MSHPAYIYPAFLHLECKMLVLLPSQTATPLSPGVGRGGGGGFAGCLWARERDVRVSALRLFHNVEG